MHNQMAPKYRVHHLGFDAVFRPQARPTALTEYARSRKSDRIYTSSNPVFGNFRYLRCDSSAHDLRPDDLQPLRSRRFSCTIRASCAQKFDGMCNSHSLAAQIRPNLLKILYFFLWCGINIQLTILYTISIWWSEQRDIMPVYHSQ